MTFDSTGLAVGAYTGNLCVTSNDPDAGPGNGTELVIVPVELVVTEPSAPAIELVKTVGTDPGVCAPDSNITVPAGTEVYYCYTVTNTGDVTLNLHDLVDDQLGTLFTGFAYALTPGSSVSTVDAGLTYLCDHQRADAEHRHLDRLQHGRRLGDGRQPVPSWT